MNSPAGTRRKLKKPSQDVANGETGPNPDPAVFEAAFVIDDEDDGDAPTRSGTPKPAPPEKDAKETPKVEVSAAPRNSEETLIEKSHPDDEKQKEKENGKEKPAGPGDTKSSAPAELPPHIKAKLRKLEKLESTYPGTRR